MSVQVEKLEKNMVKLTVEVSAENFAKAVKGSYERNKKNYSMPGFRKGKVPMAMLVKMYGEGMFYEDAINALVPVEYNAAVAECGEEIVSQGTDFEVVQIGKDQPFIFTMKAAVKPEVTLGEYKGVTVAKAETEVTEEDIMAEIKKEQEKNSVTKSVEDRAVAAGDIATIDFEGFVDGVAFEGGKGEEFPLTIGSGSFIPGFEDQIIGKEIGTEFDVNVTFPEQYQAAELAGKPAVFKVTVKKIEEKELPELDDEFASEVSEFDTVDEYKKDVAAKLAERKANAAAEAKKTEATNKAVAAASVEIPEIMIDEEADQMVKNLSNNLQQQGMSLDMYCQFTGMTEEMIKAQAKTGAEDRIKYGLVMEAIAKAEGIEATEEEIDAEVEKAAEQYKMEKETIKSLIDMAALKADLAAQKAEKLVVESAVEA